MEKLLLVRYGEHEDGHLSIEGMKMMISVSEKIKSLIKDEIFCVISADIDRAIESAKIISKQLGTNSVQTFHELYAAEESGIAVNLEAALKVINSAGEKCDMLIAVVSREYIESLPNYILHNLGSKESIETHLNRGEVLVLDYDTKNITYLR